MSFKEQTIQTCKSIWGYAQSGAKKFFSFVSQKSRDLYETQNVQSGISKSKDFYQDHKEVCIGIGIALVALTIVGIRKKKNNNNSKTVNNQNPHHQKTGQPLIKKFFLDELVEDDGCQDEVSTDAVRKQMSPKIRKNHQIKQVTQQDQRQDKIFYQMYSMYRIAGQQK